MSKKALLDLIPDSRRKVIYHEEDGKTYIETRQDVEHVVKAASILADEPPGKDFKLAGLMPEAVLNQALLEGWFHDDRKIKEWLNNPDNAHFRVWKGRC